MRLLFALALFVLAAGCATPGRVKTKGGNEIRPPTDAQAPSTVDEAFTVDSMTIHKGSVIRIIEAPGQPKVTEIIPSQDTERKVEQTENRVSIAQPRAPDQQVALRKADNAERRWILVGAGLLLLAALVFTYLRQKVAATLCGVGAMGAFVAWYASGNAILMYSLVGLGVCGILVWIIIELREKRRTKEALTRTVASIEELKVDSPRIAKEVMEYQSANLDASHKKLISDLKPEIDRTYIEAQLLTRNAQVSPNPAAAAPSGSPLPPLSVPPSEQR